MPQNLIYPEDLGAVGDGLADDTTPVRDALYTGKPVYLSKGKSFRVTSQIMIPARSGLIGRGKIIAKASDFTSTTKGFGPQQAVILIPVGATDVVLEDFTLETDFKNTPDRCVQGIVARDVRRLEIGNVRISGLNRGEAVKLDSVRDFRVDGLSVHDCQINGNLNGQLTGIAIDTDKVNDIRSEMGVISGCRFQNLLVSAVFESMFNYQTDGITIASGACGINVTGNVASAVGEGLDIFGEAITVSGNTWSDCRIFGIKLAHGARRNKISGDNIILPGKAGIRAGSPTTVVGNSVSGVSIHNVNGLGKWNDFDTSFLEVDGADGNVFRDIDCFGAGSCTYVLATGGGISNSFLNFIIHGKPIDREVAIQQPGMTYTRLQIL